MEYSIRVMDQEGDIILSTIIRLCYDDICSLLDRHCDPGQYTVAFVYPGTVRSQYHVVQ